jgi:hypothetical protein
MKPREFLAKRKTHIIFAGALFIAITLNITIAFMAGQTVPGATWQAKRKINCALP